VILYATCATAFTDPLRVELPAADGIAEQTILSRLNSFAKGKIVVTGDALAFRNEADDATLFTLTLTAASRTTA